MEYYRTHCGFIIKTPSQWAALLKHNFPPQQIFLVVKWHSIFTVKASVYVRLAANTIYTVKASFYVRP